MSTNISGRLEDLVSEVDSLERENEELKESLDIAVADRDYFKELFDNERGS